MTAFRQSGEPPCQANGLNFLVFWDNYLDWLRFLDLTRLRAGRHACLIGLRASALPPGQLPSAHMAEKAAR